MGEWVVSSCEAQLADQRSPQLCRQVADLLRNFARFARAMELLTEARAMHVETCTLETLDGALLLNTIGNVRRQQGDLRGAFAEYEQARQIHIAGDALETEDGAALLSSIGIAKREQGD